MLNLEKEQLASELRGSLIGFCRFFYKALTGRDFIVSKPFGRESHHITIAKALTRAARLEIPDHRLLINVSPGSGKSTLLCMWVAWTMAKYPDSKYIYVSYSKTLSDKQTETIKRIMQLKEYEYLFDVVIMKDSKAKDYFQTTAGGAVASAGSSGSITGISAGSPNLDRFSGALLLDDLHKPDEIHSPTMRQAVIDNFSQTLQQRLRGINVPMIMIGQRLHEADVSAHVLNGEDGYEWTKVVLKSIDEAGNALYPEVDPIEKLRKRQETDPYVFASQYQQDPIPAGGALFKPEWFVLLDEEPEILYSFIVADTAETAKSYNDATAISFFGIYEIEFQGRKTGQYGLHWIDAIEVHVEPKDLKDTFMDFWSECMRYPRQPQLAAIEKKSTGVTLISALQEIRGIRLIDIPRSASSGSKTKRFLDSQPLIAEKRVSLPAFGKHTKMCIEHMSKITANDSHRRDDLADNLADGLRMALVEKSLMSLAVKKDDSSAKAKSLMSAAHKIDSLRRSAYTR